jgi:hypothetical protein
MKSIPTCEQIEIAYFGNKAGPIGQIKRCTSCAPNPILVDIGFLISFGPTLHEQHALLAERRSLILHYYMSLALLPHRVCYSSGINPLCGPPVFFVSGIMQFPMMSTTERYCKFITNFEA